MGHRYRSNSLGDQPSTEEVDFTQWSSGDFTPEEDDSAKSSGEAVCYIEDVMEALKLRPEGEITSLTTPKMLKPSAVQLGLFASADVLSECGTPNSVSVKRKLSVSPSTEFSPAKRYSC